MKLKYVYATSVVDTNTRKVAEYMVHDVAVESDLGAEGEGKVLHQLHASMGFKCSMQGLVKDYVVPC